ncbi:MAG: DMT family transporter [Alphaproteobacteria bacterium]|nr:DMT family transporter [Alphaproteobacteria bacterium]
MSELRPSRAIGLAAAFAAAAIGAAWQIATRAGASTDLGPLDLAMLRYGVPALALSPVLWRAGFWPRTARLALIAPIFLGGGLPFGLVAMAGAGLAPVAHMGALLPGTMPLFTALLAFAVLGERIGRQRAIGFAIVAAGVAAIVGPALAVGGDGAWRGDFLFLAASALWAVFSVAYRRSGLGAWQVSALLAALSFACVLPLWLIAGGGLLSASWRDVALQVAAQGICAGLLGTWTYALAIRHLGAGRAALSGALVPALSALGGFAMLGEMPDLSTAAGIVLTMLGIALALR